MILGFRWNSEEQEGRLHECWNYCNFPQLNYRLGKMMAEFVFVLGNNFQ